MKNKTNGFYRNQNNNNSGVPVNPGYIHIIGLILVLFLTTVISSASVCNVANPATKKDTLLTKKMADAMGAFLKTLTPEQISEAVADFTDPVRFDWNYTPRARKGLTLKKMDASQRVNAMALIRLMLSDEGYKKTGQIIDTEYVLRVIESRPPNDTYRDPENYAFLIYGKPGAEPWGWRVEGHHLSLHFTFINDEVIFMPGFMGSNPGQVLADVPQKGRRILAAEEDLAFELLKMMDSRQLEKVLLGSKAPNEMFTTNSRKAVLDKMEGLPMKEMSREQRGIFKKLILEYLQRYHVTLKKQQWTQLEKSGIDQIHFAWMGDTKPEIGPGHGHYYRIHGPSFLIEFDNTQNGGNHIHSVVRDLNNDFGEDMLQAHYKKAH